MSKIKVLNVSLLKSIEVQKHLQNGILKAKKTVMSDKNKCHMLLKTLVDQFKQKCFLDYCPSKVIDTFWVKYSHGEKDLNVFDLLFQAVSSEKINEKESVAVEDFATDFAGFLMASYAVHYMNHEVCTYRCFLSPTESSEFQIYMEQNFISKLPDADPP